MSSIEMIAPNCLVFEKIALCVRIFATDGDSGATKSVAPGGKTMNGAPTPSLPLLSFPSLPSQFNHFLSLPFPLSFPPFPFLRSRPP